MGVEAGRAAQDLAREDGRIVDWRRPDESPERDPERRQSAEEDDNEDDEDDPPRADSGSPDGPIPHLAQAPPARRVKT